MTVGKYYCDYCHKEFKDTAAARKRHLQGIQHHRNRKLWYDSLSRPRPRPLPLPLPLPFPQAQEPNHIPLSTQTFGKGLCNRFLKTGICPYGDSCKYHHPNYNLQAPITQGTSSFSDNLSQQTERFQGHVASHNFGMSLGNLPPSLRPPPEGGYPQLSFVDWG